jgi:hypothetical protein
MIHHHLLIYFWCLCAALSSGSELYDNLLKHGINNKLRMQFDGEIVATDREGKAAVGIPVKGFVELPSKYRLEVYENSLNKKPLVVVVYDGSSLWVKEKEEMPERQQRALSNNPFAILDLLLKKDARVSITRGSKGTLGEYLISHPNYKDKLAVFFDSEGILRKIQGISDTPKTYSMSSYTKLNNVLIPREIRFGTGQKLNNYLLIRNTRSLERFNSPLFEKP